jgi:hypothetical protein
MPVIFVGDDWTEGHHEDAAFWTAFLRSLKARGLSGVRLVIADAHLGLGQAVRACSSAPASSAHPPTSPVAGGSRWSTSAVGRGPCAA